MRATSQAFECMHNKYTEPYDENLGTSHDLRTRFDNFTPHRRCAAHACSIFVCPT
jgi:hypothetical protein